MFWEKILKVPEQFQVFPLIIKIAQHCFILHGLFYGPMLPCKACASKLFERELVVEWVRLNVINRKPGSSLSYFREGKYEHLCPSKSHMWEEPMEN